MCRPPSIHPPPHHVQMMAAPQTNQLVYGSLETKSQSGRAMVHIVSPVGSPMGTGTLGSPTVTPVGSPMHKEVGKSPKRQVCPEFLRKLVDMLVNQANKSIIEWRDNKIHVYDPQAVCNEVLPKYFRHSKYSSFQRQLNYFGFKKTEGKGKMTPCVYACPELEGKGVDGILEMKRKINVMAPRKAEQKMNSSPTPPNASRICDQFKPKASLPLPQGPPVFQQIYPHPLVKTESVAAKEQQQVLPYLSASHEPSISNVGNIIGVPRTSLNSFELKFADLNQCMSHNPAQNNLKVSASHLEVQPKMENNLKMEVQHKVQHPFPAASESLDFTVGSNLLDSLIDEWVNTSIGPGVKFESQNSDSTTDDDDEIVWENEEDFIEDIALALL
mmetsp:Transcript_9814/g.12798  ORF Transcript_9814/g.12798 Transcript_9814/m.12798 type:complete len:386 (-) Transcript_9814:184-1341(-)